MIVYSAIYGDYDILRPALDGVPHVLFTDRDPVDPVGWTVVVEPARFEHPRLAAKWWKAHPPFNGACLWIDGSIQLQTVEFVDQVCDLLDDADLAMQRHPKRDCIYSEAAASHRMEKYDGCDVFGQVELYRRAGWPEHAGLWQCGILGWSATATARRLGAAWFAHCELLTYQDQLSMPVLAARYGAKIADIPGPFWGNAGFGYHHHRRED